MLQNNAKHSQASRLTRINGLRELLSLLVLMFFLFGFSFAVVLENGIKKQSQDDLESFGIVRSIQGTYGPIPFERDVENFETYDFFRVGHSFLRIPLWRTNEFSKNQLSELILSSVPKPLRNRLRKHLDATLEIASKYQIDPFWVLSVMWTESHFRDTAKSWRHARGLMQIMPGTGRFLASLLKWKGSKSKIRQLTAKSETNIEMGVFYLKKLLKQFRNNYRLATIAYNMGPGWVRKRQRRGLPIGNRNKYLNKVRKAYRNVSRVFRKKLKSTVPSYGDTYVVKYRKPSKSEKKFMMYPYGLPKDVARIFKPSRRKKFRRLIL